MAVFVLVPGLNNGGWYTRGVGDVLRSRGHDVYRITLTGLGERSHLLSRDIGLDTHVQDVVNVLAYEDLHDVILMGHSYAGMVISGAAEAVPERLARLVYLDAMVPRDGEALVDVGDAVGRARLEGAAANGGDGWLVPANLIGKADPRKSPHPLKCVTQPLRIGNPDAAQIPRTYVFCTADKTPGDTTSGLCRSAIRAREAGWDYRELDATHSALRTHPQEVARILLELA